MSETQDKHRPTEELIKIALSHTADEDEYWKAVYALQKRALSEIVDAARKLCASVRWEERALGVDILAQFIPWNSPLTEEAKNIVLDVLTNDNNVHVLQSAAHAEWHIKDPRSIEPLIRLKDHPDPEIRYAVVHGLLTHKDRRAVAALIELSADADKDVRDWATFGLGSQINTDAPEIHEALLRRLDDENVDVRGEALVGLARRGDKRVIGPLIRELRLSAESDEWYWRLPLEAAEEIADSALYPALMAIKESGVEDDTLDRAIAACRVPPQEAGDK